MNLFFDSTKSEAEKRNALYQGSLFVTSPSTSVKALCAFAQSMIEEAFSPHNPLTVHNYLQVEKCVEILSKLKPAFIHHASSKQFVRRVLSEQGCDLEKTYFDVPRLRTAFPSDYLASGIAYAFHPHRDTWYSAPLGQINWWIPIYEFGAENGMAFHPQYWNRAVPNSSAGYNYYEWNRTNRLTAATHVKGDTRVQPHPLIPVDPDPELRLVVDVGGVVTFSAAQLHSTVSNTTGTTRYSIDFRTVNLDDLENRRGAPNIDSACSGTTLRDYIRASDYTPLPEEVAALYYDGTEQHFTASPSAAIVG